MVRLETWAIEPARPATTLTLRPRQRTARCPLCGRRSRRVHSRYERTLADLPRGGRRSTAQRRPRQPAPGAPATARVAGRLTAMGRALGGAAGARLSRQLRLPAARNTLLRLVRAPPSPPEVTPWVLGIGDWAL